MKTMSSHFITLGMMINRPEGGVEITCKWGGCPSNQLCNLCCDHLNKWCAVLVGNVLKERNGGNVIHKTFV